MTLEGMYKAALLTVLPDLNLPLDGAGNEVFIRGNYDHDSGYMILHRCNVLKVEDDLASL
jgi:hypothetical protein